MKTIGLLGGMSWQSTLDYYRAINEGVNKALGGLHSARIAMYSVDFEPIEKLQHQGDWQETAQLLSAAARHVQAAGADFMLLCTNTMHKVAPAIEAALEIPLLHIADATAEALLAENFATVGLLGTSFTMEQDFYKGRLANRFGLQVLVPNREDRQVVHNVIYQELCLGITSPEAKVKYLRIIDDLIVQGAEAIILGCTEIGTLIKPDDANIRIIDTTAIHAAKAVEYAIQSVR